MVQPILHFITEIDNIRPTLRRLLEVEGNVDYTDVKTILQIEVKMRFLVPLHFASTALSIVQTIAPIHFNRWMDLQLHVQHAIRSMHFVIKLPETFESPEVLRGYIHETADKKSSAELRKALAKVKTANMDEESRLKRKAESLKGS